MLQGRFLLFFLNMNMTTQRYVDCALVSARNAYETLPIWTGHCMQVEVKVYQICFGSPHCRHDTGQALERPVLHNLSKGREAGYKESLKIPDPCYLSVGLHFTLINTNTTVTLSWSIEMSQSLKRCCPTCLWAPFRRNSGDNKTQFLK